MAHINEEVRQRLLTLREQKGLQQEKLANALNISRQQYRYMEKTGRIPTHRIPALCDFFGVTPDYLIDGEETHTPTRLHDSGSIFATHEHRIISDEEMKIIHRVDELSDESKKLLNDNLDKNETFLNNEDIKLLSDIYSLDKNNKEFLIEFLNKLKKATD